MPWKECHVMDERLRFVARRLEGEKMAPLCAEFGISRKTGYKIFERYKDCGVQAFTDRSRRPYRQANRLPPPVEATIVRLKRDYPGWGAPKIREKLRQQTTGLQLPAISTVHAVLDRHGLVKRRRRRHQQQRSDIPLAADRSQCALVCRLQRGISTRQPPVLLPADHHRFCQSVSPRLRRPLLDASGFGLYGLRSGLQRIWGAARHSDR